MCLASLQYLRTVARGIAHLNGVPCPRAPKGALSLGTAVYGVAGIVALLNVASFVSYVHKVAALATLGYVGYGPAAREVLHNLNLTVFYLEKLLLLRLGGKEKRKKQQEEGEAFHCLYNVFNGWFRRR